MNRITTGFHRIGVVLAVPVLLIALGWAGIEWKNNQEEVALTHARNDARQRAHARMMEEKQKAAQAGTANPFDQFTPVPPPARQEPPTADYTFPGLLAAAALALYAASRALGWIISGFAGAPKK